MISQFINSHRRSDLDERLDFRNRVVAHLRDMFPLLSFELDADPDLVRSGEMVLGLTNIYSRFIKTTRTSFDLETLVGEHFGGIVEIAEAASRRTAETWDEVRDSLLPQIMPAEYGEKLSLLSRPFGLEVLAGVVVDGDTTYSYLTSATVRRMDISPDEVFETAISNLARLSPKISLTILPAPQALVIVAANDGFDAARILLPDLRETIAERLGRPFSFAIPNRDFLVCWSPDADVEYRRRLTKQVAADFTEQPYPLSPEEFRVDEFDAITQVVRTETSASPPSWLGTN